MAEYKNFTTLIFDLGGVIIDLDWDRCIRNFEMIGINNMDTLVSTTLQKGFILDYELGKISDTQFRTEIRKYASKSVTDQEIDSAWTSLLVSIPDEKLDMLAALKKKYTVFMLSNTNNLSFNHSLQMFDKDGKTIDDFFDKCYLSYQMHLAKPSSEIFEALLNDAGLRAEECIFLDDGTHNIATAQQLHFQTEYIKPYSSISEWEFLKNITVE